MSKHQEKKGNDEKINDFVKEGTILDSSRARAIVVSRIGSSLTKKTKMIINGYTYFVILLCYTTLLYYFNYKNYRKNLINYWTNLYL